MTDAQLTELLKPIAEAIAKNCGTVPQLTFPHLFLGVKDLLQHPVVTDAMVDRFLGWPLPKTFNPDCGISFDGRKDDQWNKNKTWPIGTNLFNAIEAREMLEHALSQPPVQSKERQ